MAATDELHGARTSTNLSESDLELMRKQFSASPKNRVAQNAVSQTSIDEVALDREVVVGTDTTVSNLLDDWSVTNQKNSGRCWLFAGLNLLRVGAAQTMNLKEFEFSQNHLMFWDKLERANYFLEAMIETADRDLDDRTVAYLLSDVTNDGPGASHHVDRKGRPSCRRRTALPSLRG